MEAERPVRSSQRNGQEMMVGRDQAGSSEEGRGWWILDSFWRKSQWVSDVGERFGKETEFSFGHIKLKMP